MNSEPLESVAGCAACRAALAEWFDDGADALATDAREHVTQCAACREHAEDLEDIRAGLSGLPLVPMPAEHVDGILSQTSAASSGSESPSRTRSWAATGFRSHVLTGLAAVAALVIAINLPRAQVTESPGELDIHTQLAANQTRLVLGLAIGAVERVEEKALGNVFEERVPAAFGRVLARIRRAGSESE